MRVAPTIDAYRRPYTILALAVSTVATLFPAPAFSGEWGAHWAYSKPADAGDGSSLVGAHLEFNPAPLLGLNGAVDYRSDNVYDTPWGGLRTRTVPVTVTAKLYLPTPVLAVSPFVEAGAGWYRVSYQYSGALRTEFGFRNRSVSTLGWHAGGGARLMLSPLLSLSGEARYTFADPGRKLGPEVREQIRNLDYSGAYLAAGIGLRF